MTLSEAVAAHDAAQTREQEAQAALSAAQAHAVAVRQQVSAGHPSVTPADLAEADDNVEHARLVAQGAEAAVGPLQAAVQALRADALVESVVQALPGYGDAVAAALDVLVADVATFVARVREFDGFVEQVLPQLDNVAPVTSRVKFPKYGAPQVDGYALTSVRGASQLAAILLRPMQDIGAPNFALTELRTLAQGAPSIIPTT
jgi:hypothetical protein